MTPPRLMATDLDGTLLGPDHTVSPRNRSALAAARDAGMVLAVVTARPPRALPEIPGLAEHCDVAICANGALVYDLASGTVLGTRTIPVPVARKAAEALAAVLPHARFGAETGFEVIAEAEYGRVDSIGDRHVHLPTLDEVWESAGQIVKLLAHSAVDHADDMLAAALRIAPADVVVSHSGGRGLLEVSAAGVTKASTLAAFCEERGITAAEVVAFGDMPNDIPMLTWAGQGYAMGNAHPDVLAAVGNRAPDCADDGVAVVLEGLLAKAAA